MDTLPPAAPEAAELEAEVEAAVLLELEPPQAASAPAAPTAPATFRKSRREMKCFIMSSFCHALSKPDGTCKLSGALVCYFTKE